MKFEIHYYDSVASTMDIARDEAAKNAPEGLVIQAGEQVSGRGRRGNQWTSPKGNLYQSILLKPDMPRDTWGQLSFLMAVALADAIDKLADDLVVHLKWPNDVLIDNQKLAGILIEVDDTHVIIGTGVNIEHAPDDRAKIHDFSDISINDFRDVFLDQIGKYYDIWQSEGFAPIRDCWLSRAYRKGEVIQARLPHVIYEGVFEDIDTQGNLLLREKNGFLRLINSGEIIV